MKLLHPDKHTLKPNQERQRVAKLSSNVTRGYQILCNDYQRALHLLQLEQQQQRFGAKAIIQDNEDLLLSGNILETDFLMHIMELREEVDQTTSNEHLERLLQENQQRIAKTCHDLEIVFDKLLQQHDSDHGEEEGDHEHQYGPYLEEAKRQIAMLQYWNRIQESINEKMT